MPEKESGPGARRLDSSLTPELNGRANVEGEHWFRATFDGAAVGVAHTALDGHWLLANEHLCKILGYTRDELFGARFHDITHPDDLEADLAQLERLVAGEIESYALEKRYVRKDGSLMWASVTISLVRAPSGHPEYTVAIVDDINSRKRVEEALHAAHQFNLEVISNAHEGIVVYDRDLRYVLWNPSMERLTGLPAGQVLLRPALDVFPHLRESSVDELLIRALNGETVRSPDTEYRVAETAKTGWVSATYAPHRDAEGHIVGVIGTIVDVTERKRSEEQLRYQALHDVLTDLPNRTLLHDRLHQALAAARRHDKGLALLLLDLDRFKEVNDTFGHHCGDLLLRQVGIRLRSALRDSDTIGRLGGDEFAVIVPNVDAEGVMTVVQRLLGALREPFALTHQTFDIAASIGIAQYPDHGSDADILLQRADVAMYSAKRNGGGYAVYAAAEDPYSPSRLNLIAELRQAIESDQLLLHYQPVVHMASGRTDHVEALIRWRHPVHGLMIPDQFIPLAEHTGLIKPLSMWVLDQALRQCRAWHDAGLDIRVAVNLSARDLQDQNLIETVADQLAYWEVSPDRLEIELTESGVMSDSMRADRVLAGLHDIGVRLTIDDFGTGYSSLAHLKRLPMDAIKVDKSFVTSMASRRDDAFIVRAIIDLAHNLDLQVVAEGVETQETWNLLAGMGCDLAQGYFVGKPAHAGGCALWLQDPVGADAGTPLHLAGE